VSKGQCDFALVRANVTSLHESLLGAVRTFTVLEVNRPGLHTSGGLDLPLEDRLDLHTDNDGVCVRGGQGSGDQCITPAPATLALTQR
jgi:hypothetical protein